MTPHDRHPQALSVHRAFVVHFSANGGLRRRRFIGRVEHLSSGASARFSSLEQLLAFMTPRLDRAGGRDHVSDPGFTGIS